MRSKILELFDYRHLTHLIDVSDIFDKKSFLEQLIALQTEIYDLDALLESKWNLTELDFEEHWAILSKRLSRMKVKESKHDEYLTNIRTYLKHELMLRKGVRPTDIDLEEYYFYKSCDVQLTRRLILDASPKLRMNTTSEDWRYFDYITEINDDVTDIVEDHNAINGNGVAFLIEKHGMQDACRILKGFINTAVAYGQDKVTLAEGRGMVNEIRKWTDRVGRDTVIAVDQINAILLLENLRIKDNKTIRLVSEAAHQKPKEIQV